MNPLLSILTPAMPARFGELGLLCGELARQIGEQPVEHLVLMDNKRRSVGLKRDALLRAARGQFIAFLDDDDWIAEDYVTQLLAAMTTPSPGGEGRGEGGSLPDVITFRQEATIDGATGEIIFQLGAENQPFKAGGVTLRNAWHVCAWRRSLAILSHFPDSSYGEDWAFAAKLCGLAGLRETHVPKVLHYYRHSSATTLAPPPCNLCL